MSPTRRSHSVVLDINSTVIDDESLQRIAKQVLDMLNDADALPSGNSQTTVFRTIPSTVTVTDVQTSVVTATVTETRTRQIVPSTTFQASMDGNNRVSATPTDNMSSSTPLMTPILSLSILTASTSTVTLATTTFLSSISSTTTFLSSTSSTTTFLSSTSSTTASPTPTSSTLTSLNSTSSTSSSSTSTSSTPRPLTTSALSNLTVNKNLSSGAVAGITLSCMVFFISLGLYFLRRRYIRKRAKSRGWITPFIAEKPVVRASVAQRQDKKREFLAEHWRRIRGSQGARANRRATNVNNSLPSGSGNVVGRGNRSGGDIPAPPSAYRGPSAGRPVPDALLVASLFPNGAVAILKFDPRRPDELSVRPGDYLRVLTLFDDGWARCRNDRGQRGMVPTSCLRVYKAGRMGQG